MTQGAVKTPGKRSQAVSAKKQAILSAALETFSQFGIHGTRLEQVAEQAGVSKTNLLYYYPSKEALYIAVHPAASPGRTAVTPADNHATPPASGECTP